MAIVVKSQDRVVQKWQQRASVAGAEYTAGVQAAGSTQVDHAVAAQATWAAAVNAAATAGSFAKGLTKDPGKWSRNSLSKGAQRFGPGVAAAVPDFAKGIGPVLSTIAAVTLPPRQPRGSPANNQRVSAITEPLHKLKTG